MIFPINHHNTHWTLGCVNIRDKKIEYYDSMGGSSDNFNKIMKQYIQDEWNDKIVLGNTKNRRNNINKNRNNSNNNNSGKSVKKFDISEWECENRGNSIPQQNNSYDCGVFTCKFADWISDDLWPDFQQSNILYFRQRMSAELLTAQLVDVHIP